MAKVNHQSGCMCTECLERLYYKTAYAVLVLFCVCILGMGYLMGSMVQQRLDHDIYYIEANNLTERVCVQNKTLGWCRKLNDADCQIWRDNRVNFLNCEACDMEVKYTRRDDWINPNLVTNETYVIINMGEEMTEFAPFYNIYAYKYL